MPEMQNLNKVWVFVDAVMNENWGMHELADTLSVGHRAADIGETLQQLNMVQYGVAKTFRSARKIGPE